MVTKPHNSICYIETPGHPNLIIDGHGKSFGFPQEYGRINKPNKDYWKAYKYVWQFYKNVADEIGFDLPFTWVVATPLNEHYRKRRFNKGVYKMEPQGPTCAVQSYYDLKLAISNHSNHFSILSKEDWDKRARMFFMVNKPAKSLNLPHGIYDSYLILCESWLLKQETRS